MSFHPSCYFTDFIQFVYEEIGFFSWYKTLPPKLNTAHSCESMEEAAATTLLPSKPHFFKPILEGFHQGLLIPVEFSKYLNLDKNANDDHDAVLRTECGEWKVKIKGFRFQDGWSDFAKHHDLHVGDFVVFQHHGGFVFDVSVFDSSTSCKRQYYLNNCLKPETDKSLDDSPRSTEGYSESLARAHQEAEASSPMQRYPSFQKILTKYSIQRSLFYLPLEFARTNGLSNGHVSIIDGDHHDRKCWKVKLQEAEGCRHRFSLSKGWKDFTVANALKVGDNLSFKLIKNGERPVMAFNKVKEINGNVKEEPIEKVAAETSQHFTSRISPYILKSSGLYVPVEFAKSNGLNESCELTITDPEQRKWIVGVRVNNVDESVRIQQGWRNLASANKLKPGDVIKMERVKGEGKRFPMNLIILGRSDEDADNTPLVSTRSVRMRRPNPKYIG